MASAYRMSGQDFDENEEQDERAQLIEQLQGIIVIISILYYMDLYAHMLLCLTLALSADSQVENVETMGVSVLIVLKCPKFKVNVMCREPSVE